MLVDEDVLEPQDMYIVDRMREFSTKDEVCELAAAKQLLTLIERAVSPYFFSVFTLLISHISNEEM